MKILLRILTFTLLVIIISCNKEKDDILGTGSVEFLFSVSSSINIKSKSENPDPKFIVVSINDSKGISSYASEKIELYNFNGSYISKPISLKPDAYSLTQFAVLDNNNNIIYATPFTGSAKANLVKLPLPITFTISKDMVNKIVPEVLSTSESKPQDFGYSTFSFNIIPTFDFLISVFEYNTDVANFVLTTAKLSVITEGQEKYAFDLAAKTNKITVNDLTVNYVLNVSKPGYKAYSNSFSSSELKQFFNNPLEVILIKSSDEGLVAYYPFNGNANDESGHGNNGVTYGATLTSDRFGNTNKAYSFDGINNYIKVSNPVGLNNSNYTYSFWVKIAQLPSTYSCNFIMEMNNPTAQGHGFAVNNRYPSINQTTGWSINSANTSSSSINFQTGSLPNSNLWYNIVITRDNDSIKFYENSVVIKTVLTNGLVPFYTSPKDLFIGARAQLLSGFYFNGIIDDIRIYNRCLSKNEVNDLKNLQ